MWILLGPPESRSRSLKKLSVKSRKFTIVLILIENLCWIQAGSGSVSNRSDPQKRYDCFVNQTPEDRFIYTFTSNETIRLGTLLHLADRKRTALVPRRTLHTTASQTSWAGISRFPRWCNHPSCRHVLFLGPEILNASRESFSMSRRRKKSILKKKINFYNPFAVISPNCNNVER